MSTWASFIITLLSSCLPIRMNSSLVAWELGGMKVEPCCSHYLKFQIFFGLLGYNTEHLIPLISSFGYHLIGWTLFNFFPFSSLNKQARPPRNSLEKSRPPKKANPEKRGFQGLRWGERGSLGNRSIQKSLCTERRQSLSHSQKLQMDSLCGKNTLIP